MCGRQGTYVASSGHECAVDRADMQPRAVTNVRSTGRICTVERSRMCGRLGRYAASSCHVSSTESVADACSGCGEPRKRTSSRAFCALARPTALNFNYTRSLLDPPSAATGSPNFRAGRTRADADVDPRPGRSPSVRDAAARQSGSREIGHDIHRGPPRPEPSSDPEMAMTSIPASTRRWLVSMFRS
jgi:hypothetical protein